MHKTVLTLLWTLFLHWPVSALDIEKVKELKKLDFTNEQITAMMKEEKSKKKASSFEWNPRLRVYDSAQVDKAKLGKGRHLVTVSATGNPLTGRVIWLSSESEYKDGKRHGLMKGFFENGELKEMAHFKDGKIHGFAKFYFENGKLKTEYNFKDDKIHGLFKRYYENGKLEIENNFKDGKAHGSYRVYYENGQQSVEAYNKDDKMHGLFKGYYESGKLKAQGKNKDGKKNGLWKYYNEDGSPEGTEQYNEGQLVEP
jgi:antitoxin component YwqK of YwqJK toxin-antitoxin module